MTAGVPCIVCDGRERRRFADFGRVPRTGGFLADPQEAVPARRLRFDYCPGCGLVSQVDDGGYGADYTHVNRGTERQLPAYAARLIDTLASDGEARDGLVIEVGSNDGTFLSSLERAGFRHRLGIEPSRALADIARGRGHAVEALHLDAGTAPGIRSAHGTAAAVVCRHTLEHVPDPKALLEAMAMLLAPGGRLLVEVPDSTTILDDLFAHELWDEHLTYFCALHVRSLLDRTGFAVEAVNVESHLGSRNVVVRARRTGPTATSTPHSSEASRLVAQCERFDGRWRAFARALESSLTGCACPVLAAGASHPQTNFLHFTGLASIVDGFLDDDPGKVGRYVPLERPARVLPCTALDGQHGGTLLLTGFGYGGWMDRLRETGSRRGLRIVDPLAGLSAF